MKLLELKDRVIQLLECCDDELRRDLTRSSGGSLTSKDEKTVLESIRKLAVRTENTMVARVALHDMHQDRDEPVRLFCARLMGQANICNYSVECPDCKKDVSYTNHIVRDCITTGLSDDDIRLDVHGNESQHKTLDSLVSAKKLAHITAYKQSRSRSCPEPLPEATFFICQEKKW